MGRSAADREIEVLVATEAAAHAVDAGLRHHARRALVRAGVRWAVLALLAWWLWDEVWVRWLALAALPFALWFLWSLRSTLRWSRERTRAIVRRNDVLLERTRE